MNDTELDFSNFKKELITILRGFNRLIRLNFKWAFKKEEWKQQK
jgi:hypothetical protein